ncbi:hypothetical protein ABZZ36_32405 [Actinacidiphila glaucinigra]|uniref:hypothetical protein n=1 Tax=Actinacidiphila glaucinigra TaxID=235986 RepID=UPI0033A28A26
MGFDLYFAQSTPEQEAEQAAAVAHFNTTWQDLFPELGPTQGPKGNDPRLQGARYRAASERLTAAERAVCFRLGWGQMAEAIEAMTRFGMLTAPGAHVPGMGMPAEGFSCQGHRIAAEDVQGALAAYERNRDDAGGEEVTAGLPWWPQFIAHLSAAADHGGLDVL